MGLQQLEGMIGALFERDFTREGRVSLGGDGRPANTCFAQVREQANDRAVILDQLKGSSRTIKFLNEGAVISKLLIGGG